MKYQFSCFEINSLNKQLHINGHLIDVDERITGLMIELINHYPHHCSKSDLLAVLWPDTVVSEWSISKLVSEARNLFKHHDYDEEVIQTLHGRGYRLNSALGEQMIRIEHSHSSGSTEYPPPKSTASPFSKLAKWSLGLVIILTSGFTFNFFNTTPQTLKKSEPMHSVGRLLWVDDHPDNNRVERAYLEKHNITVYQVRSSEEALTSLSLYQYRAIISDMGRNGEVLAGLNLLKTVRERGNHTPFLMYTIVLTQAQQTLLDEYEGQGVAVEPDKLYQLVLPYFAIPEKSTPRT
jgi:DNA-binding winged helix-turn-helix (wHTH) protein/CheY-like chemotaxis protein